MGVGSPGYAFFDVDETLVAEKTMLGFERHWCRSHPETGDWSAFTDDIAARLASGASREDCNRRYYERFAGRRTEDVAKCALEWLLCREQAQPDFYLAPTLDVLQRHRREGRGIVLVSGSFPALLKPLAERIGGAHLLAARLEIVAGRYTGRLLPPQTIGEGKAWAIRAFLAERGARASDSHAYGDDISDLPMLRAVGHATVIAGNAALEAIATTEGWGIIAPGRASEAPTRDIALPRDARTMGNG